MENDSRGPVAGLWWDARVIKTKLCLRCGEVVRVDDDFGVEYTECKACGFDWEWDGKHIRAWMSDDEGGEKLCEVPEGCLLVVDEA